jgi:Magnesium chelatase, subunit ChlI C-terminal
MGEEHGLACGEPGEGGDMILRVARTIADLESIERIAAAHVSEAVNYRMLDRSLWIRENPTGRVPVGFGQSIQFH